MSEITTHVLDLARGAPAAGIDVTLERADTAGSFSRIGRANTDANGRVRSFGSSADITAGRYRLTFRVEEYFASGDSAFFPEVQILIEVKDATRSYHVPLLLSPYGYTTYRGT